MSHSTEGPDVNATLEKFCKMLLLLVYLIFRGGSGWLHVLLAYFFNYSTVLNCKGMGVGEGGWNYMLCGGVGFSSNF